MSSYHLVITEQDYLAAGTLFAEYEKAININLNFQRLDQELLSLKEMYGPLFGGIILVKDAGEWVGCIAIRKLDNTICELKRMYVKPEGQNKGLGRQLLQRAVELAKERNYTTIRLDTLNHMLPAINLYRQAGFCEIGPYYNNPFAEAVYFEKKL